MASRPSHEEDLTHAEQVKRLTIAALVSEDDLFDRLVLKGGNAIEHTGAFPVRRSIDLDFSVDGTLDELGSIQELRARFEKLLQATFKDSDLHVFDVRLEEKPPNLKKDVLGDFWGGYELRFKAIPKDSADHLDDPQQLRKRALALGKADRKEFSVDLSKHEFCGDKRMTEIAGFNVFVYSERMIVCEKIRAICQQMPSYQEVVKRTSARPRARDFFDIYHITSSLNVDFSTDDFWDTLRQVFEIKRVPLSLIGAIGSQREFHRENFESVKDTVLQSVTLKEFDFYVDHLVNLLEPLQPRWEVDPPTL